MSTLSQATGDLSQNMTQSVTQNSASSKSIFPIKTSNSFSQQRPSSTNPFSQLSVKSTTDAINIQPTSNKLPQNEQLSFQSVSQSSSNSFEPSLSSVETPTQMFNSGQTSVNTDRFLNVDKNISPIVSQRVEPVDVNAISNSNTMFSQGVDTPSTLNSTLGRGQSSSIFNTGQTTLTASQQSGDIFSSTKPLRVTVRTTEDGKREIVNEDQGFEIKDYQGIISNSSIENELIKNGYTPISKIIVRGTAGRDQNQYLKAINKKGQRVFVKIDVNGYTTSRNGDITVVETKNVSVIPYSIKTGAFNCAKSEVCGVAFECGSDAICMLAHGEDDLNPMESTFVFIDSKSAAIKDSPNDSGMMSYPIVKLSEIRANPQQVLINTDIVTRRLRNTSYESGLNELVQVQRSIDNLNQAYLRFDLAKQDAAYKLSSSLSQLEQWNDIYLANPPMTDEDRNKFRKIQANLSIRNEGMTTLLKLMKKISNLKPQIDLITRQIDDLTDMAISELSNMDKALSE